MVEGSRNTLDQNTDTNTTEANVEGTFTHVVNSLISFMFSVKNLIEFYCFHIISILTFVV